MDLPRWESCAAVIRIEPGGDSPILRLCLHEHLEVDRLSGDGGSVSLLRMQALALLYTNAKAEV